MFQTPTIVLQMPFGLLLWGFSTRHVRYICKAIKTLDETSDKFYKVEFDWPLLSLLAYFIVSMISNENSRIRLQEPGRDRPASHP